MPRQYMSSKHLETTITTDAGSLHVHPLRANALHYDAASSSHLPANLPESSVNGSTVLDIGHGVQVRASGNMLRGDDGRWRVQYMHASQYPTGRELTAKQGDRLAALLSEMVTDWAATHAADLAQADDIDRNNAARTLEEQIARHEDALRILRGNLTACDEGQTFTQYPDLPTAR